MKPLSKPRIQAIPAAPKTTAESGLFPVPVRLQDRLHRADAETLPAPAAASPNEAETVRAPANATTRPAAAASDTNYDVEIPPSPRMPFNLKRRQVSKNAFRADLLVEWVRLSANDPRLE